MSIGWDEYMDPNIEKMADLLINYSFEMVDFSKAWKKNGKRLWIKYRSPADELAQIITEKIFEKGGNVFLDQVPSWIGYTFFTKASDDVIKSEYTYDLYKLNHC